MPYIVKSRREILKQDHFAARDVGEVNFVFSILILDIFKANRKYSTIHQLRKIVNTPSIHPDFENMFYQIPKSSSLDQADVRVALDNAWLEFYTRVGRRYENGAIVLNGDIYEEILKEIDNDNKDKAVFAAASVNTAKTV